MTDAEHIAAVNATLRERTRRIEAKEPPERVESWTTERLDALEREYINSYEDPA